MSKPIVMERGVKYRDADKMALIPVKNVATEREALLRKPEWMKIKLPADSTRIQGIKAAMRKNGLHSVCEEASCPNLAECFNHGTATVPSTLRIALLPFGKKARKSKLKLWCRISVVVWIVLWIF